MAGLHYMDKLSTYNVIDKMGKGYEKINYYVKI